MRIIPCAQLTLANTINAKPMSFVIKTSQNASDVPKKLYQGEIQTKDKALLNDREEIKEMMTNNIAISMGKTKKWAANLLFFKSDSGLVTTCFTLKDDQINLLYCIGIVYVYNCTQECGLATVLLKCKLTVPCVSILTSQDSIQDESRFETFKACL